MWTNGLMFKIPGSGKQFEIIFSVTNSFGVPNCEKIFLHLFIAVEDYKLFSVSITINLE